MCEGIVSPVSGSRTGRTAGRGPGRCTAAGTAARLPGDARADLVTLAELGEQVHVAAQRRGTPGRTRRAARSNRWWRRGTCCRPWRRRARTTRSTGAASRRCEGRSGGPCGSGDADGADRRTDHRASGTAGSRGADGAIWWPRPATCRRAAAQGRRAAPTPGDASCWPGRPAAAGRCSGDWASGRPMPRSEPRGGVDVLCSVFSCRRKSVTEEFGWLSTRDRSIGGMSTAAQAAATTRRTS